MAPLSGTDPRHVGGFRVLTLLAVGGMGRVYLALGPDRQPVALKVARPEIAADARFRARFRREVATARGVGAEGGGASLIAPVVAADAEADLPWLASEYVPGPSVTDAAMEFGPLGEPGLRTLTHGLARALTEVHATGVVHRDVKPSNVLLARDGPRLIDFGVARAIDDVSLTRVGALIGSPGFLSPEQAVGDTATFGSDIFAMASVVAYAARGQSPFGAGDGTALLYRVVHEPPKLDGIPPDLAEVLAACLAKNPAERPTAREIAAQIAPAEEWLPEAVLDDIARREAELNAWLEVTAGDPVWGPGAEEAQQSAAGFDTVADSALDIANARMSEPWHAGTRRRGEEEPDESRPPRTSGAEASSAPGLGPYAAPTSPTERRPRPDLPRRSAVRDSRSGREMPARADLAKPRPASQTEHGSPPDRIRQPGPLRASAAPPGAARGLSSPAEREPMTGQIRQPGLPPRSSAAPPGAAQGLSSPAEREPMTGQIRQPGLPRSSPAQTGAGPDFTPQSDHSPEPPSASTTQPGAAYTAFLLDPHSEPGQKAEPAHRAPRRRHFPVYAAVGALVGAAVAAAILLLSPAGHGAPSPSQGPDSPAPTSISPTDAKAAPPTLSGGGSGFEQRPGTTSASGSRR